MKKPLAIGALVAGTITSVLVAGPAFADSSDYIADAVSSLQSGSSYVSADSGAADVSGFDGGPVAVVVAPINGVDTLTPVQMASQIKGQLGDQYETVIVVNTDSSSGQAYGVVPGESSSVVLPILAGGRGVENLNMNQAQIEAAVAQTVTSTSTSTDDSGFDGGAVLGAGGGLLGAVLVGTAIVFLFRRRGTKVKAITSRDIKSEEMRDAMEELGRLTEKHTAKKYPTAKPLQSILAHLNDLFSRIQKKGAGNQKALAEVEYANTIQKLNNALGADYYLDIAGNSNLWDNGEQRLREVEAAVRAVDEQVLHNIRQVNSSKDLDFRVALEGMLRSVDQASASDMIRKPSTGRR